MRKGGTSGVRGEGSGVRKVKGEGQGRRAEGDMREKKEEVGCFRSLVGKLLVVGFVYGIDSVFLDGHITRVVISFIVTELGGLFG